MDCNFRKLIESIIEKNTEDGSELSQTIEKTKAERDTIEAVLAVTTKPIGVYDMSESTTIPARSYALLSQSLQRSDRLPRRSERG